MNSSKYLNIGERFDIEVDGHQYKSDVQDMDAEDVIYISQPMMHQTPVFIPPSTTFKVVYYRPNGMFEFPAIITGTAQKGSIRTLRLQPIAEPTKYQRRMSFRVRMTIPVAVEVTSELIDTPRAMYEFKSKTIDLSEGGMGLHSPQSYPLETELKVTFSIMLDGEEEKFSLPSEVIRCTWPEEVDKQFVLGIKFTEITSRAQRVLGKYIIQEQLRLRKRQTARTGLFMKR